MKAEKAGTHRIPADEVLPEYDFSGSRPNKYASRYAKGSLVTKLDPASRRRPVDQAIDKQIEDMLNQEAWSKARSLIERELERTPEDHWLLTRLGLTWYEERHYKKALKYHERAMAIAPNCPLVLWDNAGSLDMLGRQDEALVIYGKLLRRGVVRIAHGECGEGLRWAKGLLNDCRYRIAMIHHDNGRRNLTIRYLKEHIARRQPGIPCIYPLREIRAKLAEVEVNRQNE